MGARIGNRPTAGYTHSHKKSRRLQKERTCFSADIIGINRPTRMVWVLKMPTDGYQEGHQVGVVEVVDRINRA